LGVFDVLIGINLLREGLDLPEVSLVAILDADKEGFLRSERSLIQTIGRASRHVEGTVILYAARVTNSMEKAINETSRRRDIQLDYNEKHGITPQSIIKEIRGGLTEIYGYDSGEDTLAGKMAQVKAQVREYQADPKGLNKEIKKLKKKMKKAAEQLEFEKAAQLRDDVKRLELIQLDALSGIVESQSHKVISGKMGDEKE